IPAAEESLWDLALWMTGRGDNFQILADRNQAPGPTLRSGQEIIVPGDLLLPPFARLARAEPAAPAPGKVPGEAPPAEAIQGPGIPTASDETEGEDDFTEVPTTPEAEQGGAPAGPPAPIRPAEGADQLRYARDGAGPYAAYRLKRGEALYSAVVVRYTGRVDAQDVNELAMSIARRSGIGDVTGIPV